MTSASCHRREICLAHVTVQNFQNQVSVKTASTQMDMDRDPSQQNLHQPACCFSSINVYVAVNFYFPLIFVFNQLFFSN